MSTPPLWLLPVKWALDEINSRSDRVEPLLGDTTSEDTVAEMSRLLFTVGIKGMRVGGFTVGNRWMIRESSAPRHAAPSGPVGPARAGRPHADVITGEMMSFLAQPSRQTTLLKDDEGIIEVV